MLYQRKSAERWALEISTASEVQTEDCHLVMRDQERAAGFSVSPLLLSASEIGDNKLEPSGKKKEKPYISGHE